MSAPQPSSITLHIQQQLSPLWRAGSAVAVALSGGCDSITLLHLASTALAHQRKLQPDMSAHALQAIHINHGLSPHAQAWSAHCTHVCKQLNVPLHVQSVQLLNTQRDGIEQSARHARYDALVKTAQQHNIDTVLLAHHHDDLIETFFLQMLRGASVAGWTGMRPQMQRDGVEFLRPLLKFDQAQLLGYALEQQLNWVDDESNHNTQFARNALRQSVLPVLEQHFPSYRTTLGRAIEHARHLAQTEQALQTECDSQCIVTHEHYGLSVHLPSLAKYTQLQQSQVVRTWISQLKLRAPSQARLVQILAQALGSRSNHAMRVEHQAHQFRRYRDWLYAQPMNNAPRSATPVIASRCFVWDGQEAEPVYDDSQQLLGHFIFTCSDDNLDYCFDATALKAHALSIRSRAGAERLQLHHARPSKSLKHAYQAAGIDADRRQRLPLLHQGQVLLFAAGLGANVRAQIRSTVGVCISWASADQRVRD